MVGGNRKSRLPHAIRGLYILGGPDLHDLGPDDPREFRPMGQRHADHDALHALAEHDRDQDKQNQVWESHAEVNQPEYDLVKLPSDDRRGNPQQQPDDGADDGGDKPNDKTRRHTLDTARQHVTSHIVCAEDVACRGRLQLGTVVDGII